MKRNTLYYQFCLFLGFLLVLSTACKKENESSNIQAITDKYAAEDNVKHIAEGVMNTILKDLPSGAHNGEVINGISGTANVSGDNYYYSNIDCGSDCVKSEADIDITVVFNNYNAKSCDNCDATISGTVRYTDNTWSRQSGLNYSSGGTISCSGNNVSFTEIFTSDYSTWGYSDVISFSASGKSYYKLSGWCTASNGETYNF